jgi:hypothetical protein
VSTDAQYSHAKRFEPTARSTIMPNDHNANMLSAMCEKPPCMNAEVTSCQGLEPHAPEIRHEMFAERPQRRSG